MESRGVDRVPAVDRGWRSPPLLAAENEDYSLASNSRFICRSKVFLKFEMPMLTIAIDREYPTIPSQSREIGFEFPAAEFAKH
jgi:hypothetical protein